MPVFHNNVIAGAAGQSSDSASGYKISRSLAFNKSDTPNLTRTPSSDGDRKKWTWSGWVKRGELGGSLALFGAYQNSSRRDVLRFSSDALELQIGTSGGFVSETTTASFRDPGAWYHIVVTYDSTQATAANRVKFYINGVEQAKTGTPVGQDTQSIINKANLQLVGARSTDGTASSPFDGYIAEVHFIDGQVLAPTDFGEVSSSTGAWNPIEFSGNYTTTPTSTSLSQTGWQTSQEANIWDGDTSTVAHGYNNNMVGTVTFDPPLTNVTKVEVYQQNYVHYLNGSSVTTSETDTTWHVLYNNSSSPITLTTLGNSYTNNTQTVDIFAIRINDSVVDAQTWTPPSSSGIVVQGGGVNSYYLKFADNSSNAALGTDSSGQSNTFTVNNLAVVDSSGTEVTAAWAGYTGAWATTDTWSSLTDQTTNFGNNGGAKGYSTSTETWGGDKSPTTGDFGASNRGGNGWALRYPSSTTITIDPGAQSYLSDLVVCPDESTSIANGTSVSTFPATVTGQVFWLRYTGAGYPAVDAFGTVTNPATSLSDSVIDTPLDYQASSGNNGGNYCTLNPLDKASTHTVSNGNLQLNINQSLPTFAATKTTFGISSGKFYWEFVKETSSSHGTAISGIWPTDETSPTLTTDLPANIASYTDLLGFGVTGGNVRFRMMPSGNVQSGSYTEGQVIGIAFDADAGKFYAFINGSELSGQNISAGTSVFDTVTVGKTYVPFGYNGNGGSGTENVDMTFNFGQRTYAFPPGGTGGPPSDYKSVCTTNLTDPTIADGSTAFDAVKIDNASTTGSITGLSFGPDFAWFKSRGDAGNHFLLDIIRDDGILRSNLTDAEVTGTDYIDWNSDGVGYKNGLVDSGSSNIVWLWDGGDLVTNSAYNQSQVWSNGMKTTTSATTSYSTTGRTTTFPDSLLATSPFDGDLTNFLYSQTGVAGTWWFLEFATALTNVTSIEFNTEYSCPDGVIKLNGTDVAVDQSDIGGGYVTVSVTGTIPSSLTEIAVQGYGGSARLKWVKINGKYLLDPGIIPTGSLNSSFYDQSQTWSDNITTTGNSGSWSTSSSFAVTNAFNGNDSNYAHANPDGSSSCVVTLSISPAISCNSTVTFLGGVTSSGNGTISINGGTATAFSTAATNPTAANTVTVPFSGDISSIVITKTSTGGNGVLIYGFEIDGKRLVDNGVTVTDVPSIPSTVRANTSAGFSIISYTGNGTLGATVGHVLNAVPGLLIVKNRSNSVTSPAWGVKHSGLYSNSGYWSELETSDAAVVESASTGALFNATNPGSSVFTLGDRNTTNTNGDNYIAYCWAPVEGYSAFGSYEGNGSSDGPFVYTGFRPAWVLYKNADAAAGWQIYDSTRDSSNQCNARLQTNSSGAEDIKAAIDILSNGFKQRSTHTRSNASGNTYIYAAFAEHPFKIARAR